MVEQQVVFQCKYYLDYDFECEVLVQFYLVQLQWCVGKQCYGEYYWGGDEWGGLGWCGYGLMK